MATFVKTEEFKRLNVGFELDEAGCSPKPNAIHAFNGERTLRRKQENSIEYVYELEDSVYDVPVFRWMA